MYKALSLSVRVRKMGPRRPTLSPREPLPSLFKTQDRSRSGACPAGRRGAHGQGTPTRPSRPPALPPQRGSVVVGVTDHQLALFHGRQAEHVGVFSSIAFIIGFNVDGEFLHERAREPVGKEKHPSGPVGGAGRRGVAGPGPARPAGRRLEWWTRLICLVHLLDLPLVPRTAEARRGKGRV